MKRASTSKETGQHSTEFRSVLLFLFALLAVGFYSVLSSTVQAQQSGVTIQGVVIDEKEEPLMGVTLFEKASKRSAITDENGKFTLVVKSPNSPLTVSFVGYASQTVVPGNQRNLQIKMIPSNLDLDEVVVVGFGTVKKRDLTGAVTAIKSDDIVLLPTHNALEALQGKVPGMDIVRSSGKAGAGVNITIRGNRSINGSNTPLFVIDGIQGGSYSDINPGDIESIEILKDASSTSMYGSEGANGVVIITTKKGKAGKTKVNYDGYYGIVQPEYPASMTGDEWVDFMREGYRAKYNLSEYEPADELDALYFDPDILAAIESNSYVNWLDLVLQDGYQQNHSVSVSGGSENTSAFFSLSYFDEEGLIENDHMSRYSFRSNIDHKINKFVSAGLNTQITHRINNNRKTSIITTAASAIPFGTPYDENGDIVRYPILNNTSILSPLLDLTEDYTSVDKTLTTSGIAKAYLEIRPIRELTFRSNLAVNYSNYRNGQYFDTWSQTVKGSTNYASVYLGISSSVGWDNILTYNKLINDHSFGATLLSSWGSSESETYGMTGYGQSVPAQLFYALQSTSTTGREISSEYSGTKRMAVGARLNYSYRGKYIFQATDRYEASSVLAVGHQWHHFPSVSAAWRISDEAFMMDMQNTVNNAKLRLSYGLTGNSGAGAYATQSSVEAGSNLAFGDEAADYYIFGTTIANKQLGWEMSANYDLGIDVGLWNRVNISADIYKTVTTDILLYRYQAASGGGNGFRMWQNVGASENKGIELSIQTMNISTKDFKWNSVFTISHNSEKITALIDGTDILVSSESGNLLLGHEISTYRTFELEGIWQEDEAEMAAEYNCVPGDIKVKDQNTKDMDGDGTLDPDGVIDSNDWVYRGSSTPKVIFGLSNTFQYKNFDLSIFVTGRFGQLIKHEILGRYNPGGGNFPAYFDYWTPENPDGYFPRPVNGKDLSTYTGYTALCYIDGSYWKIKTISLGYSLPKTLLKPLLMEKARIYVTASNPYYWTKSDLIQSYDPERGGAETDPIGKTVVIGANITF
jgi:TonB-linked SusC/RagA family outer membrane protein